MCEKLDIPYVEIPLRKEELYSADEILITSTTKMCISASEIDGKPIHKCKNSVGKRLIDALYSDFNSSIN